MNWEGARKGARNKVHLIKSWLLCHDWWDPITVVQIIRNIFISVFSIKSNCQVILNEGLSHRGSILSLNLACVMVPSTIFIYVLKNNQQQKVSLKKIFILYINFQVPSLSGLINSFLLPHNPKSPTPPSTSLRHSQAPFKVYILWDSELTLGKQKRSQ